MKNILLSLALCTAAQCATAQCFSTLALHRDGEVDKLSFRLRKETNVRYYLIEGSRDSLNFEVLSRVESKGNTQLPREYVVKAYDTSVRFYRVRRVGMDEQLSYSSSAFSGQQDLPIEGKAPSVDSQPLSLITLCR